MIVDAHSHACGEYLRAEEVVKQLDSNGVDKAVMVPGELESSKSYSLPRLARAFPKRNVVSVTNAVTRLAISATGAWKHIYEGNFYVQSLAQKFPERIIQFYWASISRKDILNELSNHYKEWGFKGIKLHQCWESFKVHSETFNQIAKFAEDNRLPIFIHLSMKRDVVDLVDFIDKKPGVVFVVGHLIGLEYFLSSKVCAKNVYFDLSPFPLISDYRIELALRLLGSERLIFGSDTPYGKHSLENGIARIRALAISEEQKANILGRNIARLMHLDCA